MKKSILLILAMAICLVSCEKFEWLDKNNRCIITNEVVPETILPEVNFDEVLSEERAVIVYEYKAEVQENRYFVRSTTYSLQFGETQKFVLDSRTKYVLVRYYLKVNQPNRSDIIDKLTYFYPVSKETYIKLKNDCLQEI